MSINQRSQLDTQSLNKIIQKSLNDRRRILHELQTFRQNPISIEPYLLDRQKRYKVFQNEQYLISKSYKKKAIEVRQKQPSKKRIGELIGILFGQSSKKMQKLQPVSKLDEIASKLCQTIYPQRRSQIRFKQDTSIILRSLLQEDHLNIYPNSVTCLISLGFNQPYQDIMNLLIDDGVVSRANRKAIIDPNMRYVGLATINTQQDPSLRCTVIVLTDKIIKKNISQNINYSKIQNKNIQQSKAVDQNFSNSRSNQISSISKPSISNSKEQLILQPNLNKFASIEQESPYPLKPNKIQNIVEKNISNLPQQNPMEQNVVEKKISNLEQNFVQKKPSNLGQQNNVQKGVSKLASQNSITQNSIYFRQTDNHEDIRRTGSFNNNSLNTSTFSPLKDQRRQQQKIRINFDNSINNLNNNSTYLNDPVVILK